MIRPHMEMKSAAAIGPHDRSPKYLRRDSKFFRTRQEGVLRMYEGERKRNITLCTFKHESIKVYLKYAIIANIEVVM